jgi:hypothetical protein
MRGIIFFIFLTAINVLTQGQTNELNKNSDTQTRQELFQLRRTFFDAQKQGNRSVLEQLIADSFYFVHSTGVLQKRKEFIDRTVTQASRSPEIEFLDEQLFIYDNHTAIWLSRSASHGSEGSEINFRATEVLVRKGKQWQWISVHSTKLSTRSKPVHISVDTLKAYVGKYQINTDRILSVSEDNGILIGQAVGIRQRELIPKSATEFVWYSQDSNVDMRILFIRDETGEVTHAVLRSDGVEVWRAERLK